MGTRMTTWLACFVVNQIQANISAENDVTQKTCQILQDLPFLQDKNRTPHIYSRMTASIVYDLLRAYAEKSAGNESCATFK
jgi:hypothetical protein